MVGCLRLSNAACNTSREPPAIGLFNYGSVKQNRQHSCQLKRKLNGEKDAFLCSPAVRLNGNRAHVCIVFFLFSMNYWSRCVCARGLGTAFVEPVFAGARFENTERKREVKMRMRTNTGEKPSREIASKCELFRSENISDGNCSRVFGLYHRMNGKLHFLSGLVFLVTVREF